MVIIEKERCGEFFPRRVAIVFVVAAVLFFSVFFISTIRAEAEDLCRISFENSEGTVIGYVDVPTGQVVPRPAPEVRDHVNPPAGERFEYWYVKDGDPSQRFYTGDQRATTDLTLCPMFTDQYIVVFISEGTQVEPGMIAAGEKVLKPANPSRPGWAFAEWTLDDGTPYDFDTAVYSNLVLHAGWTPKNDTKYMVALWMERPNLNTEADWKPTPGNLNHYYYVGSVQLTGTTYAMSRIGKDPGQSLPASISNLFSGAANLTPDGNPNTLKYAEFQSADNKLIYGNGSTVVNLYASRKVYAWKFAIENNPPTSYMMRIGGHEYVFSDSDRYAIYAKYEEDIRNDYPDNGVTAQFYSRTSTLPWKLLSGKHVAWSLAKSGTSGTQNWTSRRIFVDSTMISADGQQLEYTVTANWVTHTTTYPYRYFVEALPEETADVVREGVRYVLMDEYSQSLYSTTLTPKSIPGLTGVQSAPYQYAGSAQKGWTSYPTYGAYYCFFYTRTLYNLTFNGNKPDGSTGEVLGVPAIAKVKYGANIGSEPAPPSLSGYVFEGWYRDAEYNEPFTFGIPMPNSPRNAFAKWTSTEFSLTFFDKLGGKQVAHRTSARAGYVNFFDDGLYQPGQVEDGKGLFVGWTWYVGNIYTDFNPRTPIYGDYQLYAVWKTGDFTVHYEAGAGTLGKHPAEESKSFVWGDTLPLSDGTGLMPPAEKVFCGWKVKGGSGILLQPYIRYEVKEDLVLVAQYVDLDEATEIRYHANYPDHSDEVKSLFVPKDKTDEVTLAADLFSFDDLLLQGWAGDQDAAVAEHSLNEPHVDVGEDPVVHIYAIWQKVVFSYLIDYFIDGKNMLIDRVQVSDVAPGHEVNAVADSDKMPAGYGRVRTEGLPTQILDGDTVIKVYYAPEAFPIRYSLDGGTLPADSPAAYKVTETPLAIGNPAKEGSVFLGWVSGELGLSIPTVDLTIPEGQTGQIRLTARWALEEEAADLATLRISHRYMLDGGLAGTAAGGAVYVDGGVAIHLSLLTASQYQGKAYDYTHAVLEGPAIATSSGQSFLIVNPGETFTFIGGEDYVITQTYRYETPPATTPPAIVKPIPDEAEKPDGGTKPDGDKDPDGGTKPDGGKDPDGGMKPDGDKKPDGGTDPDEGKKPAGTPKPDKKPAKDDGSGEKNGGSDDGSGRRTGQDDAGGSGGEDADGQGPGAGDGNGNVNPGAGGNGDAAGGDQFSAGNNAIGTDSESESGMPVPEEPGPDQALAEKLESQTGNLFYDLIKGNLPFGRLDQRGAWGLLNLILSLLAFGTAAVVALRMFLRGIVIPEITYPRGLYWRFSGGETGEDPPAIHPRLRWLFCASGLLPFLLWIFLDRLNEPVVWINHNTIVIAILTAIQTAALTLYQRRLRLATGNTEKGQRAVEG